jgi:hypothetical protein
VNKRAEITLILFLNINEKYGEGYKNISLYVATHLSKIKLRSAFDLFPCSFIPYSRNTRELNWRVFLYSVLKVGFCEIPCIFKSSAAIYHWREKRDSKISCELLIDLVSILAALTARITASGAMLAISDFLLHDLGIIIFL